MRTMNGELKNLMEKIDGRRTSGLSQSHKGLLIQHGFKDALDEKETEAKEMDDIK